MEKAYRAERDKQYLTNATRDDLAELRSALALMQADLNNTKAQRDEARGKLEGMTLKTEAERSDADQELKRLLRQLEHTTTQLQGERPHRAIRLLPRELTSLSLVKPRGFCTQEGRR